MKAVGYKQPLPITNPDSLLDIEIPEPVPAARDLLVEIRAVSINPVDAKVRARSAPEPGEYKILGFDGAGVVKAIGPEVTMFHPGDEVWYSGTILRPGTNMELHLVDERIVGPKPKSLDFSQAAAMPLTTMTAWELLFDRLGVRIGKDIHAGSILIVGGSGGVGSILTQLARRLTGLTIVSTASSPESVQRCLELGAHFAIDYRKPFGPQMQAIGLPEVEYIACLVGSDVYYPGVIDVLAPQGKIGMIDDPADARRDPAQAEVRLTPLGIHVRARAVSDTRYDRAT